MRTGHIPLGQFPLTRSDDRCSQIDVAAGPFSGSGLTGSDRRLLFSRKVLKCRTHELPSPPAPSCAGGVLIMSRLFGPSPKLMCEGGPVHVSSPGGGANACRTRLAIRCRCGSRSGRLCGP